MAAIDKVREFIYLSPDSPKRLEALVAVEEVEQHISNLYEKLDSKPKEVKQSHPLIRGSIFFLILVVGAICSPYYYFKDFLRWCRHGKK